jgi:hypothetical protein
MAIAMVRCKWVCNFMVSSDCDGDGDGDYDDEEEPTGTSYRRADKSLARPTSRCIFFMVRFRFVLVLLYLYKLH